MAIIHRRTFYAKVGKASALVEKLREFSGAIGLATGSRILTDYQSGRTDRVVWEWEIESIGALEATMSSISDPAALAAFTTWERQINELVDYAEVEHWAIAH